MKLPLFVVDAFTRRVFSGNPAAVVPLEGWLADPVLQAIAGENNLSETAFFVPGAEDFHLRWFTPTVEVDFCGHATLATAHVLLRILHPGREEVRFRARCGPLSVRARADRLALDAPCWTPSPVATPAALVEALGRAPLQTLAARDYLAVFEDEAAVRELRPDMARLSRLELQGVIATAPGERSDFVSRYFAPAVGVPEDPVTGSAHSILTPYWAARLDRRALHALQVSSRGGELFCSLEGERVVIEGDAVLYSQGVIELPGLELGRE